MRSLRIIPTVCLTAVLLGGQTPAPGISPERQPDYQALSTAVRTLRRAAAGE